MNGGFDASPRQIVAALGFDLVADGLHLGANQIGGGHAHKAQSNGQPEDCEQRHAALLFRSVYFLHPE